MEHVIHTADDNYYLFAHSSKNYIISSNPSEFHVLLSAATSDKNKILGGYASPHDYVGMQLYIELDSNRVAITPIVVEELPLADPVQLGSKVQDTVKQPIHSPDQDEYLLELSHHFTRQFIRMGTYHGVRVITYGGKSYFLTNILIEGTTRRYDTIVDPRQMINRQIVFQNGLELLELPIVKKIHRIAKPQQAGKIVMKHDLARAAA